MSIPINSLEIKKVIEEYLRNKGYGGGTYDITIRYIPPEERVKVTVVSAGTARRAKKERIMPKTVDRPLTDMEWWRLYYLDWRSDLRDIFHYYRNNGNTPTSRRELLRSGIMKSWYSKENFNTFLRKKKEPFGLRREPGVTNQHDAADNKFRIYPLAID